MSFNRHITRNFNANKTNRIRYDDDDFRCEIFAFDKTAELQYPPTDSKVTVKNGDKKYFNGMTCYRSKNDKDLVISFKYNAKEKSSNYRIELLYANTHRKTAKDKIDWTMSPRASIKINGEQKKNSMVFQGTDVNFSRNYQYCTFDKGENKIEYSLSSNTLFLGFVVKKFNKWEAKRHNSKNDKLTLIKATVEHTKELQINTMTCEFMYHHELDETLPPTDSRANRSGFVFDYRDEINLYVKDTNGNEQQVFGGYISTVTVDDDLTKLTMECADRLIDLDRRYCLSEVVTNGYDNFNYDDYSTHYDYHKNYTNYSDPIKFLMNNNEIFLRTNLRIGQPLIEKKGRRLATYKKGGYTKFTTSNMSATPYDGSVTLRNGADTLKGQSCVIYDCNTNNDEVCLNDYPHLYFHYGLGTEKWEEQIEETSTVTVQGSTQTNETWLKRANSITSATGNSAIKPIWQYCYSKISYVSRRDFYQSASKTWSSKKGNCCCKTEVMLNLLNAKGVTDLHYVHCKASDYRGHIFGKVGNMYLDPTTRKGYGDYVKGYGKIVKVTDFPNKPF